MMPVSLASASRIYTCGEVCSYTVHYSQHLVFRTFCEALTQLDRALGEVATDDFWRAWLRPLHRYRFDMSAAPLPFDHPAAILEEQLSWLQEGAMECEALFPDFAPRAQTLLGHLRDVVATADNPMLETLMSVFPDNAPHPAAIVVKEPRLIPAVESVLDMHPTQDGISVVSPHQLRSGECYAMLAIIGPARWFPDYVFMAPRTRSINVIQFDWIDARWEPEACFAGGPKISLPAFSITGARHGLTGSQIAAIDVLRPVDWDAIAATNKERHATEYSQEKIPARLFLLAGEAAVYLDADEHTTATVIDVDSEGAATVRRVLVRRIEHGTFVLLRTEGGGDYIVPVADRIMGARASGVRAMQMQWKEALIDYVRRVGIQDACSALIRRGATHANEINVRNWMNKRTIRPDSDTDFLAILALAGLQASADAYRAAMKTIDAAHQRAGQRIRELLLAQVDTTDLNELHHLGRMDFELPDTGSGALTAFRVEDISPHTFPVPSSLLGHPFDSEDRPWHE